MFKYERHRSDKAEYLYHQFDTNLCFQPHLHRSFEFVYVEEGEIEVQIGNCRHILKGGYAALILPGQIHAYHTAEFSRSYLCVFSYDFVYDFYSSIIGKFSPNPIFRLETPYCIALLNTPGINRFRIKEALYSIVGQFLSNCTLQNIENNEINILENAVSFIQEHFCEPVTLKDLSNALGYHYNYLSAYLNEQLGMHFSDFINLYRIDYACELLEQSDLTITQIAYKCGFNTIRSFNRNFKKIRNFSPQDYRKIKRSTESNLL
ncbi:MAG TPA: AraC family transcriptional regulator [Clostridiales bacterium]|nr:AraC family transcriptional regulator [Clostridiales bacterium]